LVQQWVAEACPECRLTYDEFTGESVQSLATIAARWGADQELAACREWTESYAECGDSLYRHRRPKPPTLKEQALLQLDTLNADLAMHGRGCDLSQIRRALEALPE
jgi:hypothetical protein